MLALQVAGAAVLLYLLDDLSYPAEELVQSIVSAVGTVPRELEVDVLTSVLQLCRQINGDGEGGVAVTSAVANTSDSAGEHSPSALRTRCCLSLPLPMR